MSDKVVIIVQARLGSTRLPGKVLMPLNGYPILQHVLARCAEVVGKERVICAGVDKPEELPVRELVEQLGYTFFAGSELNVLARYHAVAEQQEADWVVRVTSDCPLLNPAVCSGLINYTRSEGADFGITEGWPHGLDCEVMTFDALERAWQHAESEADCEHVTLWIKRHEAFKKVSYCPSAPIDDLQQYRWVVDYPEDYKLLEKVTECLKITPQSAPGYRDVIACLEEHPQWLEINRERIKEWAEAQQQLLAKQ